VDLTGTSKITFLCTVAVEWNLLGAETEKLLSKSMTGSCASAVQVIMDTGARPKDGQLAAETT